MGIKNRKIIIMGIKKRIKKVIFSLALTAIMCITFTGCELPFDTIWPESLITRYPIKLIHSQPPQPRI